MVLPLIGQRLMVPTVGGKVPCTPLCVYSSWSFSYVSLQLYLSMAPPVPTNGPFFPSNMILANRPAPCWAPTEFAVLCVTTHVPPPQQVLSRYVGVFFVDSSGHTWSRRPCVRLSVLPEMGSIEPFVGAIEAQNRLKPNLRYRHRGVPGTFQPTIGAVGR